MEKRIGISENLGVEQVIEAQHGPGTFYTRNRFVVSRHSRNSAVERKTVCGRSAHLAIE
jgi:hypothetical protein